MKIERLFDYKDNKKTITTDIGDMEVRHIRKGPRGLIGLVKGLGNIKIWDKDNAESHVEDSEEDLLTKLIEIING